MPRDTEQEIVRQDTQNKECNIECNKEYDVAVYSTYCGSTSKKTFEPQPVVDIYPHFFISNNQEVLESASLAGWNPVLLNWEVSEDPVLSAQQAKIAKVMPEIFPQLQNFDYLLYKDDKIVINETKIPSYIDKLSELNSAISIRPHPFLSGNVLYEFGEAMRQPRYKAQWNQTVEYITQQLKNGCTLECQMYWTSAILRNMKHPDTIRINNLWYEHILRCGIECQISFDFIAQKFQTISLLPLDLS